MDSTIFNLETKHTDKTIKELAQAKKTIQSLMAELGAENLDELKELRDNPSTSSYDYMMFVQQLHERNSAFNVKDKIVRLEELDYLIKEPFFARIDLSEGSVVSGDVQSNEIPSKNSRAGLEGDSTALPPINTIVDTKENRRSFYIGKFGYTDKDGPKIIDWRARVASIFYRYRYPQKNVRYTSPSGEIVKNLDLKRTFEIDNGELLKYFDNDIQLDESNIISAKIQKRTGGVLEDIVETIQESQLDIIESDPRKVCIVQGCVGSGKSTVAIHKLSHIFFHFQELIKPNRAILVAKNDVLVGYLSTLFPKLGIFDINYKTLNELVVNIAFREELKISYNLDNKSRVAFSTQDIEALVNSIDNVHAQINNKLATLFSDPVFSSLGSYSFVYTQSAHQNIQEIIDDLKEELIYQREKVKANPKSVKVWIFKENIQNLKKLISKLHKIKSQLKDVYLSGLLKSWDIDVKKTLSYENTLLYMYIYSRIVGYQNSKMYQYCVVDEGQDLSLLEYLFLNEIVLHGRFCILGDLNQSYLHEGLTDWKSIRSIVDCNSEAQVFELDTNYRSTRQIIDFANSILGRYTNSYLPKSINRVGEEPKVVKISNKDEALRMLRAHLNEDLQNLDKSIGIISFTDDYFKEMHTLLPELKRKYSLNDSQIIMLDEKKRISYVPKGVYLTHFWDCKGLEFSKVYILGLDLNSISNFTDAKKAFVAITRAMNEVIIYSND